VVLYKYTSYAVTLSLAVGVIAAAEDNENMNNSGDSEAMDARAASLTTDATYEKPLQRHQHHTVSTHDTTY